MYRSCCQPIFSRVYIILVTQVSVQLLRVIAQVGVVFLRAAIECSECYIVSYK